uniref:Uncharacterized protein n=1 Tax=Setaria viridis TaxID=4556 RepID=A0A4U6UVA2_SETVI|nr:hypothetical protein SEVIR_4G094401v2 [Setaria viridis]
MGSLQAFLISHAMHFLGLWSSHEYMICVQELVEVCPKQAHRSCCWHMLPLFSSCL